MSNLSLSGEDYFAQEKRSSRPAEELDALKALVSNALYKKGVLGKIRAELREAVYTTLQEQEGAHSSANQVGVANFNGALAEYGETGELAMELVVELLDALKLNYTKSVLISETGINFGKGRRMSSRLDLNLEPALDGRSQPLLIEVLKRLQPADQNLKVPKSPSLSRHSVSMRSDFIQETNTPVEQGRAENPDRR